MEEVLRTGCKILGVVVIPAFFALAAARQFVWSKLKPKLLPCVTIVNIASCAAIVAYGLSLYRFEISDTVMRFCRLQFGIDVGLSIWLMVTAGLKFLPGTRPPVPK